MSRYIQILDSYVLGLKLPLPLTELYEHLYKICLLWKREGFDKQDMSMELVCKVDRLFLLDSVAEQYHIKFQCYLMHIINHFFERVRIELPIVPLTQVVPDTDEIDSAKIIKDLKPEDFKDKEYDIDFIKLIGVEKIDD